MKKISVYNFDGHSQHETLHIVVMEKGHLDASRQVMPHPVLIEQRRVKPAPKIQVGHAYFLLAHLEITKEQ
jgi:hypothetical protein